MSEFMITFFGLQVKVSKQFGGAYWNATLMNLTGSVVAVIIALCWNCDLKEWKLGWNIRLFTIAYAVNINIEYICLVQLN